MVITYGNKPNWLQLQLTIILGCFSRSCRDDGKEHEAKVLRQRLQASTWFELATLSTDSRLPPTGTGYATLLGTNTRLQTMELLQTKWQCPYSNSNSEQDTSTPFEVVSTSRSFSCARLTLPHNPSRGSPGPSLLEASHMSLVSRIYLAPDTQETA
jgi:hypothetical protein